VGDAEGDDFDIDNYSAGGDFEVDNINVVDGDDEIQIDDGQADKEDKPRRAVLLYQEGTAEEQIYPFTGEVMSLGRGRDNDVQVKNDSKVSRYHCKLYRRGPNFYIEDNKSANGTLVNGELITERRLFGGEEVIIGETFFRFRILD
jgi:pSer/pThr/pTyr-binding forkhead associated (FHA) protein